MAESATLMPSVSPEDEAMAVIVMGMIRGAEVLGEDDIETPER